MINIYNKLSCLNKIDFLSEEYKNKFINFVLQDMEVFRLEKTDIYLIIPIENEHFYTENLWYWMMATEQRPVRYGDSTNMILSLEKLFDLDYLPEELLFYMDEIFKNPRRNPNANR